MSHFATVLFKAVCVTAVFHIPCVTVTRGAEFEMQLYDSIFTLHVPYVIERLGG